MKNSVFTTAVLIALVSASHAAPPSGLKHPVDGKRLWPAAKGNVEILARDPVVNSNTRNIVPTEARNTAVTLVAHVTDSSRRMMIDDFRGGEIYATTRHANGDVYQGHYNIPRISDNVRLLHEKTELVPNGPESFVLNRFVVHNGKETRISESFDTVEVNGRIYRQRTSMNQAETAHLKDLSINAVLTPNNSQGLGGKLSFQLKNGKESIVADLPFSSLGPDTIVLDYNVSAALHGPYVNLTTINKEGRIESAAYTFEKIPGSNQYRVKRDTHPLQISQLTARTNGLIAERLEYREASPITEQATRGMQINGARAATGAN